LQEPLVEQVKNGSEHAFRMLVEKYRDYVFRSVFGVLRNQKDAEDASQEVWMKIYTSLPHYQHQGFKTWITRIAVNHAIDCKRKAARQQEDMMEELPSHPQPNFNEQNRNLVETKILKKEQRQLVRKRLHEIPDTYQEVIEGYYLEEKSYQQLAEEQQVQVKTIETKLYRARTWMRKHWREDDFI
jgi:RNA polymerase sigma factor (sigma-70 family)